MIGMVGAFKKFLGEQTGATAMEYALIASLIAVTIILSLTVLGSQLQYHYNEVSSNLK